MTRTRPQIARALGALALATIIGFVIGGGTPARATNGQAVMLGQISDATNQTVVSNTIDNGSALNGLATGYSVGVRGDSESGYGVQGVSNLGAGVNGVSDASDGVSGSACCGPTMAGVHGFGGIGVLGEGAPGLWGIGQSGFSISADSLLNSGVALRAQGLTVFRRSGVSTIPGTSSRPRRGVTIANVYLSAASIVLATIQNGSLTDVWVQRVAMNTTGKSFTIYLSKSVTQAVRVGWFIVN